MKKLYFRLGIVLIGLIAVLAVAGSTENLQAGSNADVSGFCRDNDDFGMSHGECVSIGETNVNALAQRGVTDGVTICQILHDVFGPFPLGNCVSRYAGY
jgi:hypothetical protein